MRLCAGDVYDEIWAGFLKAYRIAVPANKDQCHMILIKQLDTSPSRNLVAGDK